MASTHPPIQASSPEALDRSDLTERQQQILALVRAGKGNKDIANQLGIGLGTVKQHVVALFRKLNVTSRAAAITRSEGMGAIVRSGGGTDGQIEMRPACVLSLAATGGGEAGAILWRGLNRSVSIMAADHDCTVVTVPGHGIDIIFGLHRVGLDDAVVALTMAQHLAAEMEESGGGLKAGMAAGFLVASMHDQGGWTGESVAGRAIAQARELRDTAKERSLRMDVVTRNLLEFQGVDLKSLLWRDGDTILLHAAGKIPPMGGDGVDALSMIGRLDASLAIRSAFDAARGVDSGMLVLVEGENGMGKSTLCRMFCHLIGKSVPHCLVLRCGGGDMLAQLAGLGRTRGRPPRDVAAKDALAGLRRSLNVGPMLLFFDDVQRATLQEAALIAEAAGMGRTQPLHLLAACRRLHDRALTALPWQRRLTLGRLSAAEIDTLVAGGAGRSLGPEQRAHLVELAQGVPLFAVELARAQVATRGRGGLALPFGLISLIMSRLDPLALHRGLLRLASRLEGGLHDALLRQWPAHYGDFDAELAKAVAGGVLVVEGAERTIRFKHPLVREVVTCVMQHDKFAVDSDGMMVKAMPIMTLKGSECR